LVNNSGETLNEVIPQTGGFLTADDEVAPVTSKSQKSYEKVQSGEAIKVDEIDIIYDSDYVLSVSVEIKSQQLVHIEPYTMGEKGGVRGNLVLLWDTMEEGDYATMKDLSES